MHFGLFNLLQVRDPAKPPKSAFQECLAQVKLAEEIGFEVAWFAEHHFSTYSVCASPMVMAAWVAGQTKRIKLAPGVLLLPLYDPVRLIQEIGMVDLMSDGRFLLGIGTGYQPYEFERFNVNLKEGGDRFVEFLDMMEHALTEGHFSYKGKFYTYPETRVATRPDRRLPEVYVAGVLNHPVIRKHIAERNYVPLLAPAWNPISLVETQREGYLEVARGVGVAPEKFPFSVMRFVHVTDSREEALAAAENFRYSSRAAVALRNNYAEFDGLSPRDMPAKDEPSLERIADNCIVGDPHKCAEQIVTEAKKLNPIHYACFMQAGFMSHKAATRSLERFGAEVLPLVRKALPNLDAIGASPGPIRAGAAKAGVAAQ
ncbi:MAG: LLM class flavin-dependent oxidoreductase [Alphaproteobacteria bacterium]